MITQAGNLLSQMRTGGHRVSFFADGQHSEALLHPGDVKVDTRLVRQLIASGRLVPALEVGPYTSYKKAETSDGR